MSFNLNKIKNINFIDKQIGGASLDEANTKLSQAKSYSANLISQLNSLFNKVFGTNFDSVNEIPEKGIDKSYLNRLSTAFSGKITFNPRDELFVGLDNSNNLQLNNFVGTVMNLFRLTQGTRKTEITNILQKINMDFDEKIKAGNAMLDELINDIDIAVSNLNILIPYNLDSIEKSCESNITAIEAQQLGTKSDNKQYIAELRVIKKSISKRNTLVNLLGDIVKVVQKEIDIVLEKITLWKTSYIDNQEITQTITDIKSLLQGIKTSMETAKTELISSVNKQIEDLKTKDISINELYETIKNNTDNQSIDKIIRLLINLKKDNEEANKLLITLIDTFNTQCNTIGSTLISDYNIDEIQPLCKIINPDDRVGISWEKIAIDYKKIKNAIDSISHTIAQLKDKKTVEAPIAINETPKVETVSAISAESISSSTTKISDAELLKGQQKLREGNCVNEFIRIRPFLKVNDERATELQLSIANPPIEYKPTEYLLFQNKTNMITGNYCIDFTRIFSPPEPGSKTAFIDSTTGESIDNKAITLQQIIGNSEMANIGTDEAKQASAIDFVKKTNTAFYQLIREPDKTTKPTKLKAGVTGFIFNDMDTFMEANAQASLKDSTIENTGFIDVKRMRLEGTWEKTAADKIQRNFSEKMTPVTTDRFFSDDSAINKNVLIMFYGASGSGKTFSTEAIIENLFHTLLTNVKTNTKGYGLSVFSDYNNYIYDYFSTEATNRYKGSGGYTSQYFTAAQSEEKMMNDILGSKNDLNKTSKNTIKLGAKPLDDYLRMIKKDCIYRATEGGDVRNQIKVLNGESYTMNKFGSIGLDDTKNIEAVSPPTDASLASVAKKYWYFCEGITQFAISQSPITSIDFKPIDFKPLDLKQSQAETKYLKYKAKYLELKSMLNGGASPKRKTNAATKTTDSAKVNMLIMNNESSVVSAYKEMINRIKLFRGVNDTGLNAESSRSHLIIRVCNLNKSNTDPGYTFTVIDLAGTEDLNYLLNTNSRQYLNATKPDWADIPAQDIKQKIVDLKSGKENTSIKLDFIKEFRKIKFKALFTEAKYDGIDIDRKKGTTITKEMYTDKTNIGKWTDDANKKMNELGFTICKDFSDTCEITAPYPQYIKNMVAQVYMLQKESKHINNSLDSIRKLLKDTRDKSKSSNIVCTDDQYKKDNNFISIVSGVLCPILSAASTGVIVIGALNPRRSDDYNSYTTMTKIAQDMYTCCPTKQTPCGEEQPPCKHK